MHYNKSKVYLTNSVLFASLRIIRNAVKVKRGIYSILYFSVVHKERAAIMSKMYDTIAELCRQKGTNVTGMCREVGISRSILSELNAGRTRELSLQNTRKIAAFLGVSVDVLTGEAAAVPSEVTFDDFTYALYNESKELTEENKQKLLELARIFRLAQQQEGQ